MDENNLESSGNSKIVDFLLSGNHYAWIVKCMAVVVFCGLLFSFTPAFVDIFRENTVIPPAYALKADSPFADTSLLTEPKDEGERTHGAKLTPRIVGSLLLWLSCYAGLHPYTPSTLFGFLLLASSIITTYQITGDRKTSFFMGLLFSGLFACSICFAFVGAPKPFDGIALGLIGLAMTLRKHLHCLFLVCFMACWTDERSILSVLPLSLLFYLWSDGEKRRFLYPLATMIFSVLLYSISRFFASIVFGWQPPDMNIMSPSISTGLAYAQLTLWAGFEGGWLLIGISMLVMIKKEAYMKATLLFSSLIVVTLFSVGFVLDATRVISFTFPLILATLSYLQSAKFSASQLRYIIGIGAIISMLAPNYNVITGIDVAFFLPMLSVVFVCLEALLNM